MKLIHVSEREQFKKLFQQDYIDRFEDRFNILEVFLQTEQHVTAAELATLLEDNGMEFSIDFVMDTLRLMHRYGFAEKNHFDNGHVRYEHRHLGDHHDHMICTKCRKIVEFKDTRIENLQVQIATQHGFHMLQHRMEIYGICSRCMQTRAQVIPLTKAKEGEMLIIRDFTGGAGARMRLLSMGLRIDDTLEMITNLDQGQVVISAECKRYVLGRGLAQKIMVEALKASSSLSPDRQCVETND